MRESRRRLSERLTEMVKEVNWGGWGRRNPTRRAAAEGIAGGIILIGVGLAYFLVQGQIFGLTAVPIGLTLIASAVTDWIRATRLRNANNH
jgi:hypothetical protein